MLTPEEREDRGLKLMRTFMERDGVIGQVTFKDEDRARGKTIGPVVAYVEGYDDPGMRPYGTDDPDGMFYLGWFDESFASGLAKQFSVELTHY